MKSSIMGLSVRFRMDMIKKIILILGIVLGSVQWTFASDENWVPAPLIGLPKTVYALIVEKYNQMAYVYQWGLDSDKPKIVFQAPCSTGEVRGAKERAGDKKTPEGVYFLTDEYEDKYLSPVYGSKAFPTDYPNFIDRRVGKDGSAIWIHGTDRKLVPLDSNGCVAMKNHDILSLDPFIRVNQTPLIIVEKIETVALNEQLKIKKDLQNRLSLWKESLAYGDYHQYLSFYSSMYLPEILFWEGWQKARDEIANGSDCSISLELKEVGFYKHGSLFLAMFDLYLLADNRSSFIGKRKLYFQNESAGLKIVGDEYHQIVKDQELSQDPLVNAAELMKDLCCDQGKVLAMVRAWLAAWSDSDMGAYGKFYATQFKSDGMDRLSWLQRKTRLANKYEYIRVDGRDFSLAKTKDGYDVHFFQTYESSGFSATGSKVLKLVKEGGSWKIFHESWKKR